jgi:predicted nucleic acid-binding protein
MKKLRIYIDTSVIGGCLDDEFSVESNNLIELIKQEKFILLISEIIINELIDAPQAVKNILLSIPQSVIEVVNITSEILQLRDYFMEF